MTEISRKALIALGSNEDSAWGDATETVQKAMKKLADISSAPPIVSDLYSTPAFPKESGPDFINAAMMIQTQQHPTEILAMLHEIEAAAGRKRNRRWAQRTLDIDLIACGDLVLPDADTFAHWRDLPFAAQTMSAPQELILPHPRLQDRAFVLIPLADVAADWQHPVSRRTIAQMRDALPDDDIAAITRL